MNGGIPCTCIGFYCQGGEVVGVCVASTFRALHAVAECS